MRPLRRWSHPAQALAGVVDRFHVMADYNSVTRARRKISRNRYNSATNRERPESTALPSVSAILLSYNCEAFIGDALRGALSQDYEAPIEILVSDDASTDGTFHVAQDAVARYAGPHRVRLNARARNSGSKSAHLNDIFPMCSGDFFVSFDGDDVAEPSRVRLIMEQFDADPAVQAVYSSYSLIGDAGQADAVRKVQHTPEGTDAAAWFARVDAFAPGATLAVRRQVVDAFGPLDPEVNEDVVLPFRASLLGKVQFIDAPLVRVRRHPDSLTADVERFASVEHYRHRMRRGIDKARRARDGRLQDIRRASELMPERVEQWRTLERVVHESMHNAEVTESLMSPSLRSRVSALAHLVHAGAYREAFLQHACLALLPGFYLRYKRHRLNIAHRRARRREPR
jgi:cellulose synthase/poly-beta-1,6-N-acetylglucosamine synthase-like glycosyltransferase